ncbi:MAG TPA: DUF3140 domain-containing protein [Actinophytocola sp.]|jgi:hypothetical protein|nr:DUF3140 domain-containing protein [Actinophytocola sp.]
MSAPDEDQLWQEFHRVVNMTSRELSDWLRTRDATEDAEAMPDQTGQPVGRQVLHVLGKRHGDLTGDDRRVMRKVVDKVRAERREDLEPVAGQASWRHRLMSMGHDPLKPA